MEDTKTRPESVTFTATITQEEIRQMVHDQVRAAIRGHRSSVDEDGNTVEWEESPLRRIMEDEARSQVAAAVNEHVTGILGKALGAQMAAGFAFRNERGLTLAQMVDRMMNERTRENYNGPERTLVERYLERHLEEVFRTQMADVVTRLRKTFEESLTQKFRDAAAEALRRAVGV